MYFKSKSFLEYSTNKNKTLVACSNVLRKSFMGNNFSVYQNCTSSKIDVLYTLAIVNCNIYFEGTCYTYLFMKTKL